MGQKQKTEKEREKERERERKLVITMAKLRMAHASTHGARKPPGPKYLFCTASVRSRPPGPPAVPGVLSFIFDYVKNCDLDIDW